MTYFRGNRNANETAAMAPSSTTGWRMLPADPPPNATNPGSYGDWGLWPTVDWLGRSPERSDNRPRDPSTKTSSPSIKGCC